jgi:PLP dependent protein
LGPQAKGGLACNKYGPTYEGFIIFAKKIMDITANYRSVLSALPQGVKLIAVSKTKPNSDILQLYNAGHRLFGENKVQELAVKYEALPKDIQWHFIGHLQSNKVKYIAPYVNLIHGVDSLKLLSSIDKEGAKNDRAIDCLLQFHIAREESKFGLSYEEACEMLQPEVFGAFKNIRITGVMGMATYTDNVSVIRGEFKFLKSIFHRLRETYFPQQSHFKEISMGMSGDYAIAVEEGSTMVRIGSSIFGERG